MKSKLKLIAAGVTLALVAAVLIAPSAFAHGGWGWRGADRQESLADALGVTVDELQAAQDEAADTRLDQAVEDGWMTAEQAELSRATRALGRSIDKQALMAEALGVSTDELADAQAEGKTQDLLDSEELDMRAYRDRYQAAYDEAVAKAVDDGVITQEQADALQEQGGKLGGCTGGHGMRGFGGAKMHRFRGYHRGIDGEQARGWAPRQPRMILRGSTDL